MSKGGNHNENLKPCKKGETHNPNGRPVGAKSRSTILKKWIEVYAKIKNPETQQEISGTIEDKINLSLISKALEGDVQAIKEINDTLYGKIPDKHNIDHSGKIKINFINE